MYCIYMNLSDGILVWLDVNKEALYCKFSLTSLKSYMIEFRSGCCLFSKCCVVIEWRHWISFFNFHFIMIIMFSNALIYNMYIQILSVDTVNLRRFTRLRLTGVHKALPQKNVTTSFLHLIFQVFNMLKLYEPDEG